MRFETTIEDADRRMLFDVRITVTKWRERNMTLHTATDVDVLGGRVAFPGMLSAGVRPTKWVAMDESDLGSICHTWFSREYAEEIGRAIDEFSERIEIQEVANV